jgi:hypothetical protein
MGSFELQTALWVLEVNSPYPVVVIRAETRDDLRIQS